MIQIVGVDEAGRGPLVGSVVAAAVILNPQHPLDEITDSKRLSAKRREDLAVLIKRHSVAWAVAEATVAEIDELNILQASLLAMQRAVLALAVAPTEVRVDGNQIPQLPYPCQALVKGDLHDRAIGAASILAKVSRDEHMRLLDKQYPEYGFAQHKGYPTAAHRTALQHYGPCPQHRRSFAPVRRCLEDLA